MSNLACRACEYRRASSARYHSSSIEPNPANAPDISIAIRLTEAVPY